MWVSHPKNRHSHISFVLMSGTTHFIYSLCFKPKCSMFNRPVLTLNNLNISTVNQSKYLGIIISENNCAPDLNRQMCKLYANVNMITRKFSRYSPNMKCFVI